MPRFVVLEHDTAGGRHWDFMLEMGDVLATWALGAPPDAAPEIAARALPDHRKAYLDYEGPVSGDHGSVTQWDGGTYQLEHRSETQLEAMLSGTRLHGRATLVRSPDAPNPWRFSFSP